MLAHCRLAPYRIEQWLRHPERLAQRTEQLADKRDIIRGCGCSRRIARRTRATRHGVFGITRTSRVSVPSPSASVLRVKPAAMEMTRCRAASAGRSSAITAGSTCGFTARMRTSHAAATAAFASKRGNAGRFLELHAGVGIWVSRSASRGIEQACLGPAQSECGGHLTGPEEAHRQRFNAITGHPTHPWERRGKGDYSKPTVDIGEPCQ